jgi:hypothetical protein
MIISTNPKFIFLHIPKTAGTSVEESLYDFHDFDYNDDPHMELLQFYDDMTREEYDEFYKFTVIRNPFTLLYSTWAYYVRNNGIKIDFNDWIKWRYREPVSKYKGLVNDNNNGNFRLTYYMNRYPQTFWLVNHDGEFIIDHTIRFENLEEELGEVFEKLGLGEMYLPHANKTANDDNRRYIKYYDEESIEIVKKEFKIDFELFGYSLEQDESVGGNWGDSFKGKSLGDFGFHIPDGVKLNVGSLPYGPHDIIHRYFADRNRDEDFKEFTKYRASRRLSSLESDISNIKDGIERLQEKLQDKNITDDEVNSVISHITRLTERDLVYKQKVIEIRRKLKSM